MNKNPAKPKSSRKLTHLITPFLFALSFLLYTNYWVVRLASPDQLLRLLIVLWISLGIFYYPAYLVTRSWEWASVLLTILVLGFYVSQDFFRIVGSVILLSIILWQLYYRFRRLKLQSKQLFLILNSVAFFLILFSLYLNIRSFAQVPWSAYRRYLNSVNEARNYSLEVSSPPIKPDIYYIVLDGYLRSDMLQELYGYDNTAFISYLKEKNFIVPGNVHSNYAKTAVSIPSTLNMDYIDSLAPGLEDSYFWWLTKPFINHSRVRAILESQGYQTISLSTDWSLTDNPTTDMYLHSYPIMLTDFERYYLGDTPMKAAVPLIKNVASVPTFDAHRKIILHSFTSLQNIPELPGPKFIFAHIPAPHPPFAFDRHGDPINPPVRFSFNDANDFYGSANDYQRGYVGQVEFVNMQIELVVDAILKKSKTPPIIIIQADHGSGLLTDFTSAENTCIKERFSPFAAYYLPGLDEDAIPADITPVNLFRIIFNQYFSADLPLLENRQYFYKDTVYIYRPVDVTSRLDEECKIP